VKALNDSLSMRLFIFCFVPSYILIMVVGLIIVTKAKKSGSVQITYICYVSSLLLKL
jgi:hypothetical protein